MIYLLLTLLAVSPLGDYFKQLKSNPNIIEAQFGAVLEVDTSGEAYPGKEWNREPLEGKSLLVYPQKGFGDTLQFIRFLSLIDGDVTFDAPLPLRDLLRDSGFPVETVDAPDYKIGLLSLPHLLGVDPDNLPYQDGYLNAEPKATLISDKLKVGLVWSGNPNHPHNPDRMCPLDQMVDALSMPGVQLYSLQYGQPSFDKRVIDLGEQMETFADMAGLICDLDVFVTVDTSALHLAGGLGCPCDVYALIPQAPDQRWVGPCWYKKMHLLHQQTKRSWTTELEQVRDALQHQLDR